MFLCSFYITMMFKHARTHFQANHAWHVPWHHIASKTTRGIRVQTKIAVIEEIKTCHVKNFFY